MAIQKVRTGQRNVPGVGHDEGNPAWFQLRPRTQPRQRDSIEQEM